MKTLALIALWCLAALSLPAAGISPPPPAPLYIQNRTAPALRSAIQVDQKFPEKYDIWISSGDSHSAFPNGYQWFPLNVDRIAGRIEGAANARPQFQRAGVGDLLLQQAAQQPQFAGVLAPASAACGLSPLA